ncbi:PIN domain-containing protein [Pseudomonas aeruginosa]
MPKGNPTAAQLWAGDVSFFSLDTDVIQAAGYNFNAGALKLLPTQLPDTMSLNMSEVVAQEIVSHRMESIKKATEQFRGASNDLKRLAQVEMSGIDGDFDKLSVEEAASKYYYKQISDYVDTCGGTILQIDGIRLTERLFRLYFESRPPFEERRAKKSEFPDATSLLILEDFARDNRTMGVVASADEGWSKFADASEYLYCVRSIDELAALFAATGNYAKEVEKRVSDAVQEEKSSLRDKLHDALVEHIEASEWTANDVTGGTVARVEAYVYEKELISYEIDHTEVWKGKEKKSWVIELNVSVKVKLHLDVEFYAWDSIDREEISLGSDSFPTENTIEVEVFFTCSGVEEGTPPEDWQIEIEIANGLYECDPVDVEPDFYD